MESSRVADFTVLPRSIRLHRQSKPSVQTNYTPPQKKRVCSNKSKKRPTWLSSNSYVLQYQGIVETRLSKETKRDDIATQIGRRWTYLQPVLANQKFSCKLDSSVKIFLPIAHAHWFLAQPSSLVIYLLVHSLSSQRGMQKSTVSNENILYVSILIMLLNHNKGSVRCD